MKRLLFAVPLLLVVGCVKPPIEGRYDPYVPAQIHLASEELRRDTAFNTPRATRDEAGLLHVTVPIRATTDKQLYVDYRTTFFDANGQVLSQSSWIEKTLAPNVFDQVEVNSMSPRATDFQVDFRYAR